MITSPTMSNRNQRTSVLIYLCITYCDLVCGKVSQINYGKHPFELRSAFPSTPRPPIIFYSGNTTLSFSASNINPMGFDFSKIHSSRPQQPTHAQSVVYHEKPVIPLAWVNLPLFDTPTFSVFNNHHPTPKPSQFQYSSGEPNQVQNDSTPTPPPTPPPLWNRFSFDDDDKSSGSSRNPTTTTTDNTDNGTGESRSSRAHVVKSDWDGRTKNEIQIAERSKIADIASLTSTTTSTPNPLPLISQPQIPTFPLERRIQLSNRGRDSSSNSPENDHIISTLDIGDKGFETREASRGLHDGEEDPFVSESRMEREQLTGSRVEENFAADTEPTIASIGDDGIIQEEQEEAQISQPVAVSKTLSPVSPLSFGVPTQTHHKPNQNYHHQNSGSDYRYQYAVSNTETMDVHSHSESRTGALIEGEYSVLEPDGYTRIVSYTADSRGFRATVRRVKV